METGTLVLAGSWLVAAATAFVLRTRAPGPVTLVLLAGAGVGLAWGGMLLREDPHPAEVGVAVAALAVLVPAHVRIVLGPFGPRRA